jgi:hypothetical protein
VTRFAYAFIPVLIIAILFVLASAVPLEAQTGSVNMEGTVWDPSGDPLPGATLTAVEEKTGHQVAAVTDSEGDYRFLALQPGSYTVTVKAKGFKDVIHRGILVFAPGSTYESFTFEVAAIDKDIMPGEYPRFLDSDTYFSLSQRDIDSLPLLNVDPLELLAYQPGVQVNGGSENSSTVNGTRLAMNTILMDGISITDPIDPRLMTSQLPMNPNSISDFQIVTAGGKAEYGRSGGGQFVAVSRSGEKSWSGNLYDYITNSALNANSFFNNSQRLSKPGLSRNIFGGTIGGPIGKQTLIFANYEGRRTAQKLIRNRIVLTDTAKVGLFRWYIPGDIVQDDTTIQTYNIPGNDPRGLGIDPSVKALLDRLPEPNNDLIGDFLNLRGYQFENPTFTNHNRVVVRVDHELSAKHQLFARFNWAGTDATDVANNADAPYLDEPYGIQNAKHWGVVVGSNYTLNPNMVNELRVGYLKPDTDLERPARSSDLMFAVNSFTSPLDISFPRSFDTPTLEIADYFSHARKQHFFKYGFDFKRTQQSSLDFNGVYPNATLGLDHGNAPPSSIGPSERSEISAAERTIFENLYNDLLGRVESQSQTYNSSLTSVLPGGTARERHFATNDYAFFIQDSWRARTNLTINVGLRYEINSVPHENNDYQAVLDQAEQISETANISNFSFLPSDKWYSKSLTSFAPRAGFSWDMFSSGKSIIRGSYGVYYDRLIGGITNIVDQNTPPFSQIATSYPNTLGTDLRLSDNIPLPTQPAPPVLQPAATRSSNVAVWDQNISTPRVHHFSIAFERRLLGSIIEIAYVGTRGKKLFQHLNMNQTKTSGDFLQAFTELQAYRSSGTPVSETNTLVRIFGTPLAAINALGGSTFDTGQAGLGADILDRDYYSDYAPAGVSDFYIRNFPQFNGLIYGTNSAESRFDSLQMGIRRSSRYSHLRAYYTWSESTDNMSLDGSSYMPPRDSFNPTVIKTPSDFDRTHVFTLAWDYAIPIGRNPQSDSDMPKWVNFLFAGWNIGVLMTAESGARFSVNSGLQTKFAGVASYANLDEDANRDSMGNIIDFNGSIYWFDLDQIKQFTYPVAGEDGNSGRNSFKGPKYYNMDFLLHKKFMVGEKQSVMFRFEAYNLFNRANFGLPNTNIFDSNFGIISTTVGNPRIIQAALRYQF